MRKFFFLLFLLFLFLLFAGCEGRTEEPEFRVHDNHIQWKYKSEDTWKDLISLDELKGPTGTSPTVGITPDGYWVIDGVKTNIKAGVQETFTVKYELEGGTLPDGTDTVEVAAGSPVPLPVPVREGFEFWVGMMKRAIL